MKKCISLAFLLLLLVGCSEADTDAPSAALPSDSSNEEPSKPKKNTKADDEDEKDKKKNKDKTETRDGPKKGAGGGDGTDDGGVFRGPKGGDGGVASGPDPGDNASAAYPAAGDYVFSQRGFEKFCGGGSCDKQGLPKQQTLRLTVTDRSKERTVVVGETASSDHRMLRTTTAYTRGNALITDVYTRLSYQGFTFENEYNPAPPVESLRFPLRDGAAWRGSWEDSTSGNYEVRVFGPTSVTVSGRSVRTFQVATTTEFRGEFEGEAKTLAWIDPATKAVVKLSGSADLTSTYGRYVTEFSTSLRSGPRY